MKRQLVGGCLGIFFLVFSMLLPAEPAGNSLAANSGSQPPAAILIQYPLQDTLFPPDCAPVVFRWKDQQADVDAWHITLRSADESESLVASVQQHSWIPSASEWRIIQRHPPNTPLEIRVEGYRQQQPDRILSLGRVRISVSNDPVGAPLFYREVPLPFGEALNNLRKIRWRFGVISTRQIPPVVLEDLPTCGNCHSFSLDGRVLGMDLDYGGSKGTYLIARTSPEMELRPEQVIDWDSYKRAEGGRTLGLLSALSPDGRRVISTVKDESILESRPNLDFSQLFFPIRGILAVYDCDKRSFAALPGADDLAYVQTNPAWSPDGKTIVFARAKAFYPSGHERRTTGVLSTAEQRSFLEAGHTIQYDLYHMPFNDGKGGRPEPLVGASGGGASHYFPRFSPNGRWIVFCEAQSYMLLQPDSALYIIPAAGGQARRLRCNTAKMNSWHSWSPNSRWLAFSSKENGPYTQVFLTHIDDQGESTPPVLLDFLTETDRAANIPEFVNLASNSIVRMVPRHFGN